MARLELHGWPWELVGEGREGEGVAGEGGNKKKHCMAESRMFASNAPLEAHNFWHFTKNYQCDS
jgi:hypothetical protein